jgi:hypothetical protein
MPIWDSVAQLANIPQPVSFIITGIENFWKKNKNQIILVLAQLLLMGSELEMQL